LKLAISNIAWPVEKTEYMLNLIKSLDCEGVEVAPSKMWSEPVDSSSEQRKEFLKLVKKNKLTIAALHALFYTRKDLSIFGDEQIRLKTMKYLKMLVELAADLETKILVFGSPAARDRKSLKMKEALNKAAEFFYPAAEFAERHGVCIVMEPLRKSETNFINTAFEGLELVRMVNSNGFKLHLDAKSFAEEAADHKKIINDVFSCLKHFHINDPDLIEVGSVADYHPEFGKILRETNYNGFVSIEMKTLNDYEIAVKNSINLAKKFYIGKTIGVNYG
jgi:D-psicose/D-tagatose/L-ribulose 3-epimerase